MSNSSTPSSIDLASYLFARREAILNMWRASCEADKALQHVTSLSREEFNDQIPTILNLFEQRLRSESEEKLLSHTASEHGLHRWHKGYSLRELLAELNHFIQCLTAEISCYREFYPTVDPTILTHAYEQVIQFSTEIVNSSLVRYDDLQRKQAAGRAEALQKTLEQINELTQERGKVLRMTSHDLRGRFGVIQGAAVLLDRPNNTDQQRKEYLNALQRNLTAVSEMLTRLMDLARLEAGQETLHISEFDASELLRNTINSAQPLATERGLTLRADGPDQLPVQTDSVKVQRIVQNLLLNALQYTNAGMISVSWSNEDNHRWIISVQDTGPGLPDELAASLSDPLKPMAESSSVFENNAPDEPANEDKTTLPSTKPSRSFASSGEGIGLFVVKRLCELLDATLDIETLRGRGTLFRVRMATHQNLLAQTSEVSAE